MSVADVLGLSLGGGSSTSENGRVLAGSILHSRESLDAEAVEVVKALASRVSESNGDLDLLVEGVATCSPAMLHNHFTTWTQLLTNVMRVTADPSAFSVACRGVSVLLRNVPPGQVQASHLSPLLHTLLSFSSAMPALQVQVLGLLTLCLVRFPSSCSQHRPAIKKWASTAVCDSHLSLAQEGSRVLVLLCQHSNQQWSVLMECVSGGVEWLLNQLDHHTAMTGPATPPHDLSPWVALPTLPPTDPERTSHLVQMLSHLVRILCHGLLFPPRDSALPPPVPLERVLALVTRGLEQVAVGHVMEALVLQVTVPVVHTMMWNMLCVLIKTCHSHLLPHSAHIMTMLMSALCSKDSLQFPQLLAAVHRTLVAWMGVAKDLNAPSISPLLRALVLSSGQGPVPTSSLHTLAVVISCIGPLIPPPLAPSILQIPMTGLTPHVSADVALPKLRLLLACMGSGNTHLCPPTSATVQVLTDLSNHHASREVIDFCLSALSQLSLKLLPPQLSAEQPVAPPTSVAPPTTQPQFPLVSYQPSDFMTNLTPPTQPTPCENKGKRKRVWPEKEVAEVALTRLLGEEVEDMSTIGDNSPIAKRKIVNRIGDSKKMAGEGSNERWDGEVKETEKVAEVRGSVEIVESDSEGSDGDASGMEHFVSDSSMDSD